MSTPVEQIKERLNIEDVVGSYVKLERAGKNLKAKCPFHNEKTPSFYVSPDRGGYYCFGCGAKGDIFNFVQQFEGLDFVGALKLLADKAGVELKYERDPIAAAQIKTEKGRLYAIMEEATQFFQRMLASDAGAEAREYISKRGITTETVKEFRLGFVPNEWRLLYTHLKGKDWNDSEIEKAGLAKRPEASETAKAMYDRFRDRVIFPISDSSGRVIAFSGRILHDDDQSAKYLNSPDTPLYTKSTVLYGLDKAKQEIRRLNYTIFVEGQMDLVMSHQAGIKNTVAVSGTALSDAITTTVKDTTESPLADPTVVVNNLGVVRRLSPNLILAFDSDSAGRKAALRSAQIALSLGMDVKIAQMQDGKDPADMVLKSVDTWKDVLRKAKPVVEFELDQVLAEMAEKKLDQRKLPALLREKVYPFIAALDSNTDQGAYVKLVREKAFGNSESEQFIWDDLKEIKKKMKVDTARDSTTRQSGHSSATIRPTAMASRLDLISRKLFGLLAYLAREKLLETDGIHARVRSIAGDERYNNLIQNTTPSIDELILEAELFFGPEKVSEKNLVKVKKDIDEMLLNFEEDIIKEDFASAMAELMRIEKSGDVNAQKILMEKFQMLNTKKAEIERKKQS